jgi:vacuolar-type H+-ATPase subunit E/Vma4
MRGPIDEVVRDAIARLKEEQKEERERLEEIKDEQKRRARERQRDGVEC